MKYRFKIVERWKDSGAPYYAVCKRYWFFWRAVNEFWDLETAKICVKSLDNPKVWYYPVANEGNQVA